jgi:hypothetical protein
MSALRKIEQELAGLIAAADEDHPIDLFALSVIVRKISAQAEIAEQGLEA